MGVVSVPSPGDRVVRELPPWSAVYRDDETGDGWNVSGLASATGKEYEYGNPKRGGWVECIAPGAFRATLGNNPDVVLNINHSDDLVLARTGADGAGLRLWESDDGLRFDADMDPDDPDAQKARAKLRAGTMNAMSFAFRIVERKWTFNDDGPDRLDILAVDLDGGDVSLVTHPASPHTNVTARADVDPADEIVDLRVEIRSLRRRVAELCARLVDAG